MVVTAQASSVDALYAAAERDFQHSEVHMLLSLMFSGAMRWDLLHPWRPFADRFVLSAGHTVPLVYATLAVLNEVFRVRYERDRDERFAFPDDGRWALTWESLLKL